MSKSLSSYTCFFLEESIGIHVERVLSKGGKLKKECLCYSYEDTLLQMKTKVTKITTILKLRSVSC
jgi:hypothetical protein